MPKTRKTQVYGVSVPSAVKTVSAATTLNPGDNFVRCGAGTYAVTLPPITDCADETFVLYQTAGSSSVTVTLGEGYAFSKLVAAGAPMTAVGDYRVIKNVGGVAWIELAELST